MKRSSIPFAFGIRFLIAFAVLAGTFEAARGTAFERITVEDFILKPTATFINLIVGGEPSTQLHGRTLVSGATRLHVTRGCEGIEMFLLLTAGILAYPAALRHRVRGMLVGFALAFALSVLRLAALDCTLRFAPGAWESLHGLVMPLAPVLVLAVYFLWWTGSSGIKSATLPSRDAHAA
jgi:exosortase/archaeosortase family protein